MRTLIVATLFLIALPTQARSHDALTQEQKQVVVAAYRALAADDLEAKKIDALPEGVPMTRIDVSEKIRSASFGHKTMLLVPPDAKTFYVEYGKSTNRPGALFGPFDARPR
jgi:hypothetical protein